MNGIARDILALGGMALICGGIYSISPAVGLIAIGCCAVGGSVAWSYFR